MPGITASPFVSRVVCRPRRDVLPFPFGEPNVSLWHRGLVALWQGIRALGLEPGSRVLMPAYSLGALIAPFLQAGLQVDYYRLLPDFNPDFDHLDELCRKPASALLVTHFFGFAQPMRKLVPFAESRGLLLIEDNAHGLLSADENGNPLGSFGDMSIFSIAKTFPTPDGGALLLRGERGQGGPRPARSPGALIAARRMVDLFENGLWRLSPRLSLAVEHRIRVPITRRLKGGRKVEGDDAPAAQDNSRFELKMARVDWGPMRLTRRIIPRADAETIRANRRRNFSMLAERIQPGEAIRPVLGPLPEGCCPWLFPVLARDPETLVRELMADGIDCDRFWHDIHPHVPIDRFPFERELMAQGVWLPIHQDLTEADMLRIADAVNRRNVQMD